MQASASVSGAGREIPGTGDRARSASLLQALGNPLRLAMVLELATGGLCVHELVDRLGGQAHGITQPLVSQHLRVLRSAQVVVAGRRGKENLYELVDARVTEIVARALEHTRRHR